MARKSRYIAYTQAVKKSAKKESAKKESARQAPSSAKNPDKEK